MNLMDLESELKDILISIFPADVSISKLPIRDEITFIIDWKLNNDPNRPNKRSKKIHLNLSQEALEDYSCLPLKEKSYAKHRFISKVKAKLDHFNPNHDHPHGTLEPIETWLITSL